MNAQTLTPSDLTQNLARNAVTVVLLVDSRERCATPLIKQLQSVANTFRTGVGFGWIDTSTDFDHPSIQADDLVVTPILLFFRGTTLLASDMIGQQDIQLSLNHGNIDAIFGHTRGGARLIE